MFRLIYDLIFRRIKPKEMEYKTKREHKVLYIGKHRGYKFYILSLGTHPTAYVKIPKKNKLYGLDYLDVDNVLDYLDTDINVHGGFTFSDDHLYLNKHSRPIKGWFLGWDYAHCYDYVGFYDTLPTIFEGKKWTTKEIILECMEVIDQIKGGIE